MLGELLREYVEQGEVDVDNNKDESRSRPPLFGCLTSLSISETNNGKLEDPRVISYVLAHARRLKSLRLEQTRLKTTHSPASSSALRSSNSNSTSPKSRTPPSTSCANSWPRLFARSHSWHATVSRQKVSLTATFTIVY